MPIHQLQRKLIAGGAVAGALLGFIALVENVGTHAEPYLPSTHAHTADSIAPLWAELIEIRTQNDKRLAKEAAQNVFDFWISKCIGDAPDTIDSDMDVYYDEFKRVKLREHNWRDNNGGNEEEVFVILRRKGKC